MKEELNDIVCQSSSDYEILYNAYDYIEKLEQKNKSLQSKLKAKEEVIEEARGYLKGVYEMSLYTKSISLDKEGIEELEEILSKGENK